jgi:hypothetical protein
MNYGLKGMWKEGVVANFKEFHSVYLKGLRKNCAICEASALEGSRNVRNVRSGEKKYSNFMEQITLLITCCHFTGNPMVH